MVSKASLGCHAKSSLAHSRSVPRLKQRPDDVCLSRARTALGKDRVHRHTHNSEHRLDDHSFKELGTKSPCFTKTKGVEYALPS